MPGLFITKLLLRKNRQTLSGHRVRIRAGLPGCGKKNYIKINYLQQMLLMLQL